MIIIMFEDDGDGVIDQDYKLGEDDSDDVID